MSKASDVISSVPPAVAAALKKLGEDLAIARVRRKESQRLWARRLGVSTPTLIRLEQGDPRVAAGTYAAALWLIGRTQALGDLADPQHDRGALELDVRAAATRRAVRSAASLEARLARKKRGRKGENDAS